MLLSLTPAWPFLRWASTALATTLLFSLVASRWYTFYASWSLRPSRGIQIWCGRVRWHKTYPCTGGFPGETGQLTLGVYRDHTEQWWYYFMKPPFAHDHFTNTTQGSIALWPPLLLTSTTAITLWRRKPRRAQGVCARCGYDLRGLSNPRCSECGSTPR